MTDDEVRAIRERMREIEAMAGPQAVSDMEFRRRLTPETDRGAALTVRAYLEHRLGELLRAYLVQNKKLQKEMYEGNGPLATFSSRINMSYSIGLLSADEMKDFHAIRSIANEFAHSPGDISFADPHVISRVANLSGRDLREVSDGSRLIFVTTAMTLLAAISAQVDMAKAIQERPNAPLDSTFSGMIKRLARFAAGHPDPTLEHDLSSFIEQRAEDRDEESDS